jgi:hypothetical protein
MSGAAEENRDGYPGRGLSGCRERAGGDLCSFLGLVFTAAEIFAGTG